MKSMALGFSTMLKNNQSTLENIIALSKCICTLISTTVTVLSWFCLRCLSNDVVFYDIFPRDKGVYNLEPGEMFTELLNTSHSYIVLESHHSFLPLQYAGPKFNRFRLWGPRSKLHLVFPDLKEKLPCFSMKCNDRKDKDAMKFANMTQQSPFYVWYGMTLWDDINNKC